MKFLITSAVLILAIPFSVCANDGEADPFSGFIKFEKYHSAYEVNADGTYTEANDTIIAILTEQGVKYATQADISYSESMTEAVISSAYTLKKDGRRVEVPAANIQERAAVAGGGHPYGAI